MYLKRLSELSLDDVPSAGGKGASLGEMVKIGIPVPPGFVLTTKAYKDYLKDSIPQDLAEEIYRLFDELECDRVAVRSSAVAEDSSGASWAGQLESYLNVTKDQLIDKIRDCWNSIHSERAIIYSSQQNIGEDQLAVAVVVQKMVNSECSGVMFSVNPITKDDNEVMIESSYGLGEMIVQGEVTPDNFVVNKKQLNLIEKSIGTKDEMIVFMDGTNAKIQVEISKQGLQSISDERVLELAKLAVKIERLYGCPQDIEWAIEKNRVYIVQSRPITTI